MATNYIKIISCGSNYLQAIRVIRQITGLGLKDAMDLADNLPIDLFATDQQIKELKSAGATVAEQPITTSGYASSTTRTVTTSSNYSTKTVNSTNSTASSIPQRSFNTQQSSATKRSLPPNTYLGMSGKQYQLSSKLGSGGEGGIFAVSGDSSKVAKIYHSDRVSKELEEKLRYMVNKPPRTEVLSQVAWPMDVLYDGSNKFIGFVMPKLTIDADLGEIYVYPPKGAAVMPYNYKLIIAMNICSVIHAVHQAGY
ncbi:ribosomal protein L7/L12, partial [Ruminococcus difficilis]